MVRNRPSSPRRVDDFVINYNQQATFMHPCNEQHDHADTDLYHLANVVFDQAPGSTLRLQLLLRLPSANHRGRTRLDIVETTGQPYAFLSSPIGELTSFAVPCTGHKWWYSDFVQASSLFHQHGELQSGYVTYKLYKLKPDLCLVHHIPTSYHYKPSHPII